jgi:serine/threonine protein kinase
MEFCSGGSCADLMKPGQIREEYITIIIRELLMGLEYLHGDNKLHRDIKGNIEDIQSSRRFNANMIQLRTSFLARMDKSNWPILACRVSCRKQ